MPNEPPSPRSRRGRSGCCPRGNRHAAASARFWTGTYSDVGLQGALRQRGQKSQQRRHLRDGRAPSVWSTARLTRAPPGRSASVTIGSARRLDVAQTASRRLAATTRFGTPSTTASRNVPSRGQTGRADRFESEPACALSSLPGASVLGNEAAISWPVKPARVPGLRAETNLTLRARASPLSLGVGH